MNSCHNSEKELWATIVAIYAILVIAVIIMTIVNQREPTLNFMFVIGILFVIILVNKRRDIQRVIDGYTNIGDLRSHSLS